MSELLALYDLQKVPPRSLEYRNRIEWWEKERVNWLAHREKRHFFVWENLEKKV